VRASHVAVLVAAASACSAAPSRFALRPPVTREADDRPLARAPAKDDESEIANALDVTLLRPLSRAWLAEAGGEARNVNALDEVPDSSWFTNRAVLPADLERGPCPAEGPALPLTVKSSKTGGTTPGFVVKDAKGARWIIKVDALVPRQPELSTAADAIVSRLYWAAGFNAPCNEVVYVDDADMLVDSKSTESLPTGRKRPLSGERLRAVLARATRDGDGRARLGASRFIDGEGVGTWRTEGRRDDDPNDRIPHEARRELRGERLLAAWLGHWDSRGPNTYDAFVPSPGGAPGSGYVKHYFLDFSDALGGTPARDVVPDPRLGHVTVSDVPTMAADLATLGAVRRPWDEVKLDRRYPDLGYYDVRHFEPLAFAPQTPLVRWARARPDDLGWMARRIARLGPAHVDVAVRAGRLSSPAEEAELRARVLGRRERVLRAAFRRASALADVELAQGDRLCATDLGVLGGVSESERITYTAASRPAAPVTLERTAAGVCVHLLHGQHAAVADDAPERYLTLELARRDGEETTVLRAHLYDLGPARGFFLAGLERP